ncbi:DJ-1/PfpI family protein [Alkaliphilus peptidifermentans]|uniref:Putative intracellular protease/amidase n=1 Tax=Alkaliphilus peptidifermentans DSM 18978 TaxID=1120976 RepID=A0A1G5J7F4_9FIRM|nr:DJ-1/PfpI family protein [Alkaliphilus peptidifermentans]SCY84303.1 Putative intracellular protease/amidase [Alkaliphilus peptidifermentans DSM 18978]
MGKIAFFIYDDMADFEITFAAHLLGTNGYEIVTIAYEDKLIRNKTGVQYKPLKQVKDIINEDIEGLIITGGWNGEIRPELMDLIHKVNSKDKLLAAICAGPRYLAKAGILNSFKYTTSISEWTETHNQNFGDDKDPFPRENYIFDKVIRDRNVITAQGTAFIDFAVEICDWFKLFKDNEEKVSFLNSFKGIDC